MANVKPVIGVSLKTYMTPAKTASYVQGLAPVFESTKEHGIDFFIIPDLVSLGQTASNGLPNHVILGAQDCFWDDGAYTGTVSPRNLKEIGVGIVEIGHAERRRIFKETDEDVAKKAAAAAKNGIIPLVCIGELERDTSAAIATCEQQIKAVINSVPKTQDVIIAYEPVWAIGQPAPAEPEYVTTVARGIKKVLAEAGRPDVRVIYGGSAGPGLFQHLVPELDGLFLGRMAHDPARVLDVINEVTVAMQ